MNDDPTERRPSDTGLDRPGEVEHTGAIEHPITQPIPGAPPETEEHGWFRRFAAEHPTEGPVVPARADSAWGSDRADALAEESHRARHAASSQDYPVGVPYAYPGGSAASRAAGGDVVPPGPGQAPLLPPPSGAPVATLPPPTGPGEGMPTSPGARRRGRRALLVTGIIALCLASGVVGGIAGQVIEDRVVLSGRTLPEPGPGVTDRPAGSVANIAAQALPSVVTIKVDAGAEGAGTGSGFVIDNRGHILTNNHVVAAGAKNGVIEVVLSNGETERATIVGRDVSYDLAVLRIERTDLTPLRLGASDKVVVGDSVIAVGAPLGLDQTVTSGIVSALNRPVAPGAGDDLSFINAIQTDAAINPGNSGGPLLDLSGQVIGVNSAIARVPGAGASASGNIGLGFAIPSDQARRTADQLISTGKATHPIIGVMLDRTYSGEGALVQDDSDAVTPDAPADKAGVQPGDVIVGFEGEPIRTPDQLIVSIRSRAVGETVTLTIERDGEQIDLEMTLEADPEK
ncbi:trypsin-like peptidase domain-containing protein [Intrasporangium calvum]|uniref:Trypsin-like peptidase domain-containing protein n=1 Tax=Intrasporangium calvum TaxID=53358 RepID=A0ABT5GHL6_9MICO|nr:trypsin-like peptidase domain-containing protein [Intrasporangium calvum]MDC5697752.1 trypsin-like peptidase domain-containing protein [Intrasporangium calvum]